MYPKNEYLKLIEAKLENLDLKNIKKFSYSPNQKYLLVKLRYLLITNKEKKSRVKKKNV